MGIPTTAGLHAELHCLSHDGRVVITAQHWRDPAAPASRQRSWLRLVRNGRPAQVRQFTGECQHEVLRAFWVKLAADYAPTALDGDEMWIRLRQLAGVEQTRCLGKDCAASLPVGWWLCPACGRDARRVARGSLSGSRRRGEILLDNGVFSAPEHQS